MLPIRTILHPTDFSVSSNFAFRLACALARDYGARLLAVHVLTPPVVVYGEGILPAEPTGLRDAAKAQLQQLAAQDSKIQLERRLVEGDPATEIVRVAKEANCDVIVMGTHGRKGLGRVLMGSVAEQVLRKATCPVLTAKRPLAESAPAQEPALAAAGTNA